MKALALALLTLALLPITQASAHSVIWQQSVAPTVTLSIRDKNGDLGSYRAVFAVTLSDGRVYTRNVNVTGDEEGTVEFPSTDFVSASGEPLYYAKPGLTYKWEARVNGATVIGGEFVLGTEVYR